MIGKIVYEDEAAMVIQPISRIRDIKPTIAKAFSEFGSAQVLVQYDGQLWVCDPEPGLSNEWDSKVVESHEWEKYLEES